MTEILGTPNLAKTRSQFHGSYRTLWASLGGQCLAHSEQNPQQTADDLNVGLETCLSSMAN